MTDLAQKTIMECIVLKQYGKAPVLKLETKPPGSPGPGEVLIKVMASPINPSDLIFLHGDNPNARQLPSVPGFEGSGMVVKSGGGEEANALVGKRVAFRSLPDRDGAWAEYAVTAASRCIPLLSSVSSTAGAMLLVNPLTAWALVDSALKAGHKCAIQNAAASALGKMVVRYAAERGLALINVVRKQEQVVLLKNLEAEIVVNSTDEKYKEVLRDLARIHNATVAFDAIAGGEANDLLKLMPRGSELWSYGGLSQEPLQIDPMVLIYEQKSVKGFWGPPTFYQLPKQKFDQASREIQERLESTFKTDLHGSFTLSEFAKALEEYQLNMTRGKVVFQIS